MHTTYQPGRGGRGRGLTPLGGEGTGSDEVWVAFRAGLGATPVADEPQEATARLDGRVWATGRIGTLTSSEASASFAR
jgi:hypothetical protein